MSAQPSFFQAVSKFAKPFNKDAGPATDPITVARRRFVEAADDSIKQIEAGVVKGFWFKQVGEGYVVQLKNGPKVLENCAFAVGNKADAVKLLNAAKDSCGKGEFDQQFKDTARAPRKMKSADPKLNPPADAAASAEQQPAATDSKKKK